MKLTAEVSIDVDHNRKIWITASADNVDVEDVAKVQQALNDTIIGQALAAYKSVRAEAMSAEEVLASARARGAVATTERRPRPEDPESMRAFGED